MGIKSSKVWYDRRSRKMQNQRKHIKKKSYGNTSTDLLTNNEYNVVNEYRAVAPVIFSFVENFEETATMFGALIDEIKRGIYRKRFFFDSSNVEKVTTDVLVYIIAIMRNIKCNKIKQYSFAGNLPKKEETKRDFEESGLYKYVQTKNGLLPPNNEKMQIITGRSTDATPVKQICEFVMKKFGANKTQTRFLYVTIIELMSNVVHHAYNDKEEIMYPCWYLYAEYKDDKIKFVFIDTGLGIATTVRKRIYEKIKFITSDADLIESAFNGEFRTETRQPNRGLGMPALKSYVIDEKKFSDFYVMSGNGGYRYTKDEKFKKIDLKNKVYGTIYIFEVSRKEIVI